MEDFRVEIKVSGDGSLIIKDVPFQPGDKVEVIVRSHKVAVEEGERYPLRGKHIRYADPLGSVAEGDWDALG